MFNSVKCNKTPYFLLAACLSNGFTWLYYTKYFIQLIIMRSKQLCSCKGFAPFLCIPFLSDDSHDENQADYML